VQYGYENQSQNLGTAGGPQLPSDWTTFVGAPLDNASIAAGKPYLYLTQELVSLQSPTGCVLCVSKIEAPSGPDLTPLPSSIGPDPVSGAPLFGVAYNLSFSSGNNTALGPVIGYAANGALVSSDFLYTTAAFQGDNSWLLTYYYGTPAGLGAPTLTKMFSAQIYQLDPNGVVQPYTSISTGINSGIESTLDSTGIASLSLLSPGMMDELIVSPVTGGSVDVLLPASGSGGLVGNFP
jgi:hypothetical protein